MFFLGIFFKNFFISILFFFFGILIPHELGHFIVAKISDYEIEEISILFFKYNCKEHKFKINLKIWDNYIQARPKEKNLIIYFLIGVIINITIGLLLIFMKDFNFMFLVYGYISIFIGLLNLIPKWKSDGHFLCMLLFPKKFPLEID